MIEIVRVRYDDPAHAATLVDLLDAYARDPAGGGEPLGDFIRLRLGDSLGQKAADLASSPAGVGLGKLAALD